MRRNLRWLALAPLVAVNGTVLAVCVAFWLAVAGLVNLGIAWRWESLPALGRAVTATSRSVAALSVPLRAWGALPQLSGARELGESLAHAASVGRDVGAVLPTALGEQRPMRYLVCALNDAELFGSGGAPLDVFLLELDKGRPRVMVSGSVAGKLNPDNDPYPWPRLGGPPWYQPSREYPFANSNLHPDFGLSGPNIAAAWQALGYPAADGVITVDMYAVAAGLRAAGPIMSADYGQLTGDNIIQKVLVDAYRRWPEQEPGAKERRRAINEALRGDLIAHLRDPGAALRAARAVSETIPGRHVQAHMALPQLQAVVVRAGAQATLLTPPGDLLGVFLQSGVSKLAVFQERTIRRRVTIAADGSASVSQDVTFSNAVPQDLQGDRTAHVGYLALIFRQRVAFRIPRAALDPQIEVVTGRPLVPARRTGPFRDDVGAAVLWQGQDIPPGGLATTRLAYRLPAGTFSTARGLAYRVTANPQATVLPTHVEIEVDFPAGSSIDHQSGWEVTGASAQWSGQLDRTLTLALPASQRG